MLVWALVSCMIVPLSIKTIWSGTRCIRCVPVLNLSTLSQLPLTESRFCPYFPLDMPSLIVYAISRAGFIIKLSSLLSLENSL